MPQETLLGVLAQHATGQGVERATHFYDGSARAYDRVSYQQLSQRAFGFGARLIEQQADDVPILGRVVLIACYSPYATLVAFYGAVSVGAIPMIFPMPLSLGSHTALSNRIRHWGLSFEQPAVLVLEEGLEEKFHEDIPTELSVIRQSADPKFKCREAKDSANGHVPAADDVAFYQTTSSSTGDHKAVAISHQNVIANITGIRAAVDMHENERMASWLPLFHDMGLVGAVLFTFCNNYEHFLTTPTQFIKRPALWLKTMQEQQCTVATAPNFGFDYCTRLVSEKDRDALDLSGMRNLFIGAEPVRVSTIQGFVNKFAPCGVTPAVMRPAYGLAESTIITSISSHTDLAEFLCLDGDHIGMGEPIKVIDRINFTDEQLSRYEPSETIAVCTGGRQIADMHLEIIDEAGRVITEQGVAGEIALTGTSVAMGYVWGEGDRTNSDAANPIEYFPDGRMRTGDIGVLVDGEVYILERLKNVVTRNGENYLVSALEEKLAELLDISHEHVAVFESDIHDPSSDIVVFVERHKPISDEQIDALLVSMPKEAFPINRILLAASREIPRTTSGKKRHFYCRKLYRSDEMKFQQNIEVSPQRIMQAQGRVANTDE